MIKVKLTRKYYNSRLAFHTDKYYWGTLVDTHREIEFTIFNRWKFAIPIEPMRTWEF